VGCGGIGESKKSYGEKTGDGIGTGGVKMENRDGKANNRRNGSAHKRKSGKQALQVVTRRGHCKRCKLRGAENGPVEGCKDARYHC